MGSNVAEDHGEFRGCRPHGQSAVYGTFSNACSYLLLKPES